MSRVVAAHLSYLAIFNPSLGATDETVRDQIVFYYSQKPESERERHKQGKTVARRQQDGPPGQDDAQEHAGDHAEAEENERLRQVGLAQGMVDFVKNFSRETPLESIETEKSRVLLKEVEPQWWILAAVDFTKLPPSTSSHPHATRSASLGKELKSDGAASIDNVEYSSREVAPAQLLLAQLVQAHRAFLLHHATCLSELWEKHENDRPLFCSLLHRHWTRFIWNWDVLLHANPAIEMYDAIKLAGGGELGIGVGEEEWGSGEREVLEGFAGRTDGLLDLIVGRYGDAPVVQIEEKQIDDTRGQRTPKSLEPWLGNGEAPRAQDGIIFSGLGSISRRALVTISQWMQAIYVHGEEAYGVGENPASRPRRLRKGRNVNSHKGDDSQPKPAPTRQQQRGEVHPRVKSPRSRAPDLRRKAMENNATPPNIPAPLVSAVERSLDDAIAKASAPESQQTAGDSGHTTPEQNHQHHEESSLFGTEKMMKYLSLGYGSSWTLNPKGFSTEKSSSEPTRTEPEAGNHGHQLEETHAEEMREVDPSPEVSDEEEASFVQRLEQSIGKFLIGLSGDLENAEFEDDSIGEPAEKDQQFRPDAVQPSSVSSTRSNRIFLRTLTMEMSSSRSSHLSGANKRSSSRSRESVVDSDSGLGKTSASASVDGAQQRVVRHEKVQVAVYVHQPFVFVFLFELHTPSLSMPGFYRAIHHTLGPLQKSLLRSTDPERWKERLKSALEPELSSRADDEKSSTTESGHKDALEIYDLVYDPVQMTVRTSIPNIPLPGSLAAEGLHRTRRVQPITVSGSWYTLGIPVGSSSSPGPVAKTMDATRLVKSDWTRVEALNVHTQILNMWAATQIPNAVNGVARTRPDELERTVKTARGWWVVWMRVPSPEAGQEIPKELRHHVDQGRVQWRQRGVDKEAILVRRSAGKDRTTSGRDTSGSRSESRSSSSTGRWLLREQPRSRDASGTSTGTPPGYGNGAGPGMTNAKGVNEGVGVDARKWVEGLIRLSM